MQRRLDVTVPSERTPELLAHVQALSGVLGLRVYYGVSMKPPGDLVSIEATTTTHLELMQLLQRWGIGRESTSAITLTETNGVVTPEVRTLLHDESSQSSWEQIQLVVAKEGNTTAYALVNMALAGVIAAAGLTSGALHVVIAAMVIAPGFEPILRVPLGWVVDSQSWRRSLFDIAQMYLALAGGAALAGAAVRLTTGSVFAGETYLPVNPLVTYWTTLSVSTVAVAAAGGLAGAILVATNRSILTNGVMIALGLIPTAALVGIGVVAGDLAIASRSLIKWIVEVVVIASSSGAFWFVYRARVQPRPSIL